MVHNMDKGDYISPLLRSNKTVFSFRDIALLWRSPTTNAARVRINYYVKNGELVHLRKGLYAKDVHYDRLELAAKIYIPSYVSFETVLAKAGVVFQFYEQIFAASYLTREVSVDTQTYAFRKIKNFVLTNPMGIENKKNCSIAGIERAFLDTVYINVDYHFDNLSPVNWDRVFNVLPIYKNKTMEKRVQKIAGAFKVGE